MSYIIIHSEVRSGNRVVQIFLSLFHFPPQIPSSGGLELWLMTNHSKLLWRTFHSQWGNWSFLLCILHLGPNRGSTAHFTAEPDNKMMINIGLHQHSITTPLTLTLWTGRRLKQICFDFWWLTVTTVLCRWSGIIWSFINLSPIDSLQNVTL